MQHVGICRCPLSVAALFFLMVAWLGITDVRGQSTDAGHEHMHAQMEQGDSFFGNLLKVYTPRRVCMNNESAVIWLHLITDTIIAVSYFSIPIALVVLVRSRKDLAFNWIFVCFAVFILACGTTHVINILSIWRPIYRVDGIVKLITAIASVGTALVLWPLIPKAIAIPSPTQLRVANERLAGEVEERKGAEESLRQMHAELEKRVAARTAEIQIANTSLKEEIAARRQAELEREALLTSERAARSEAERANQMKDEFLATLSHELRTPLNAILGWSHLLQHRPLKEEDLEQGIDTIERNARAQTQLVEDLLDMSRIISGKLRLDVQSVSPVSFIEAAITTVRPSAEARGIRLETMLDPQAGPVAGDPNRLQQVIWNLLSNAIKFTPRGGKIQVVLERVNSHLEISVADTGQGIDAEFLPHVFERFRQADASTTRKAGGLGLGLSIVKQLVELHGGTVRVTSPGTGLGATFIVHLPLSVVHPTQDDDKRLHPTTRKASSVKESDVDLTGLKLLVIDDEPDALVLIQRVLAEYGAEVVTVNSAAEALSLIDTAKPQVLISDIGMPEMDGYEFIRRLRALGPAGGGRIPAIALTAFARSEDRTRALMAGFLAHVAKPVEPSELLATVASIAGRTGHDRGETPLISVV